MSDAKANLGHGFYAERSESVGVYIITNDARSVFKTLPLSATREEMEAFVAGYLAGQASTRDPGKVRMCGMVGAAS